MICKRFEMVSRKWLVRIVTTKQLQAHLDKHPCEGEDVHAKTMMGLCEPGLCRIFINKDLHHSDHEMEYTFWHEFVHALKYANGEQDHNEEEVDRMAGYLHQYHDTARGTAWDSISR